MKDTESTKQYFELRIEASSPNTDIWLGDDQGHLVQKETGVLQTNLLPGKYVVQFRLGGRTWPINLDKKQTHTEEHLRAGPSCPRPKVTFLNDDQKQDD